MTKNHLINRLGWSKLHPQEKSREAHIPKHVMEELTKLLLAFKQVVGHAKEMREQQHEFPSPVNSVLAECASRNVLFALDRLLENVDSVLERSKIDHRRAELWVKDRILNIGEVI